MSRLSLATGGPTLADQFFARRVVIDLILIAAGAALVALSAQLSIPLWPVSITAQTLAVILVGATLGALRGALSLTLYAVVGFLGLPVFYGASSGIDVLFGGTGGYIVGFIFAAALAGWLAHRGWDRRLPTALAAMGLAVAVPYLPGLPWLGFWLGSVGAPNDPLSVLGSGLFPFIIGEVAKVTVAAVLLRLAWHQTLRVQPVDPDDVE